MKELSNLYFPALEFKLINGKTVSIGNIDNLQTLALGFWKRILLLLMEIREYLEHTDAIVP